METSNIRLIWDFQTEGTDEQGWYTRHSQYGTRDYLDAPIGDATTSVSEAIALTCERFGCNQDDIRISG